MSKQSLTMSLLSLACVAGAGLSHGAWASDHHAPAGKGASQAVPAKADVVDVQGAWIRATVPGQSGTGGFMTLRSARGTLRLQGFASPVASTAELHEMAMDGQVMRMRPVAGLDLPEGQTVVLKPGGHHLMLMGLKQPLKTGDTVPLVLTFKTPEGALVAQTVQVPVRMTAPAAPTASQGHETDHGH